MRVLFLSYDGMTDPLGQSQVIPYLAGLSKAGHEITIISFEKKNKFEKSRELILQLLNDLAIQWHPLSYTKKPPVLSTAYDLIRMRHAAKKIVIRDKIQVIHCRSQLPAMIGLSLKKMFSCKIIFDMRGFWADERVDGKLWNLKNPVYKFLYHFLKRKEKELLVKSDHIISLTENAKKNILSWKLKKEDLLITVIPCCADLNLFSKENISTEKRVELKKSIAITDDNFVLLYLGALGTWYMLDEMLDFFKQLLQSKPESKFLIVTNEEAGLIKSIANQKNIPVSTIIIRSAERKDVPLYISVSDSAIFFIKPAFSKSASSPTKQGEIMAMGIPIICNAGIGDTDEILMKAHGGWLVKNFDSEEYAKVITQLDESRMDESNIIKTSYDYYSLEKGIEKYSQVYQQLSK